MKSDIIVDMIKRELKNRRNCLIILGSFNLLTLFFLIYTPTINLFNNRDRESNLKESIVRFEKRILEREKRLKELEEEQKEKESDMENREIQKEKSGYFENSYQALNFFNNLLTSHDISIEAIGREKRVKLKENLYSNSFYIALIGKEKDIYNFFKSLESSKKDIYIIREGTIFSSVGDKLKLESNVMYIDNNKNIVLNEGEYRVFLQNSKPKREINSKRRKI